MSPGPADLASIRAAAARLRDDAEALLALLDGAAASPGVAAAPAAEPDWKRLHEAAAILKMHPDSVSRIARKHGLARRLPGLGLQIDMNRVAAWRDERPYERLSEEIGSDRKRSSHSGRS